MKLIRWYTRVGRFRIVPDVGRDLGNVGFPGNAHQRRKARRLFLRSAA